MTRSVAVPESGSETTRPPGPPETGAWPAPGGAARGSPLGGGVGVGEPAPRPGGPPRDQYALAALGRLHPAAAAHTDRAHEGAAGERAAGPFRILSPLDGDRYQVPPGVDARYATIALRAAGASPGDVRWFVDGRRAEGTRWPLAAGAHTIRAVSTHGDTAAVRIEVRAGR